MGEAELQLLQADVLDQDQGLGLWILANSLTDHA